MTSPSGTKMNTNDFRFPNKVELVRGGKDYFNRLVELIDSAKECIHLQVYILDNDETGNEIAEALIRAAARKVIIYVMADGYASQGLEDEYIQRLTDASINFRFFKPVFKSSFFYFGRRMHHKVVVADSCLALVGGVNISNKYNDMPGKNAWLDFAVYVEGAVAEDLCVLCWKTWNGYASGMPNFPCEKKTPANGLKGTGNIGIRSRRNDWVRGKNQISKTYITMFRNATSHITILSSYFIPGRVIRRNIRDAVKRGVTIKVIVAGMSDLALSKAAERYMYDWLLRNGVQIYEYQDNILHGKLAVCDDQWMTIGSYNVNDLSAYASIELNLDIQDAAFANHTEEQLEKIIAENCIPITRETHLRAKNIFKQFSRWFSYKFTRLIFKLFTFYFKQEK
jgi:cardiolipin synthase